LKGSSKLPNGDVVRIDPSGVVGASCPPVVEVVDADDRQVDVAARGVEEVVAADGHEVPVAAEDHDMELGVGQLEARGERNGPAVGRVEGIDLDVAGDPARAADPRDDGQLVERDLALLQGLGETVDADPDAAGRAPDVRHPVHPHEIVHGMFFRTGLAGRGAEGCFFEFV
jgi:hypothetical protein